MPSLVGIATRVCCGPRDSRRPELPIRPCNPENFGAGAHSADGHGMNTSEDSRTIVTPGRLLAAAALTSAAMETVDAGAVTPCDQSAELFIETGTQLIGHGAIVTIDLDGES